MPGLAIRPRPLRDATIIKAVAKLNVSTTLSSRAIIICRGVSVVGPILWISRPRYFRRHELFSRDYAALAGQPPAGDSPSSFFSAGSMKRPRPVPGIDAGSAFAAAIRESRFCIDSPPASRHFNKSSLSSATSMPLLMARHSTADMHAAAEYFFAHHRRLYRGGADGAKHLKRGVIMPRAVPYLISRSSAKMIQV